MFQNVYHFVKIIRFCYCNQYNKHVLIYYDWIILFNQTDLFFLFRESVTYLVIIFVDIICLFLNKLASHKYGLSCISVRGREPMGFKHPHFENVLFIYNNAFI